MDNCLISKLKATVDNDNLTKYGCFRIKRRASENYEAANARLTFRAAEAFTITAKGSGFMADSAENLSDPEMCYTEKEASADTATIIFFSNGDYEIEISAKYSVINITASNSSYDSLFELNIDDFKYDSNIGILDFESPNIKATGDLSSLAGKSVTKLNIANALATDNQNSNITGDISVLSSATEIILPGQSGVYGSINSLNSNLNYLLITGSNCEGTASQLGRYTSLTRLFIGKTRITGSVEDLVASFVQNGRTSFSGAGFFCYGILSKLSFGGIIQEPSGYRTSHRLEFDGTRTPHKITVKGSTSGKKWFISGWTQAEIDDYTQQGYTLINCDQT